MAFGFGGGGGINTGPSPNFMTLLSGGLNRAAQNFGDPMSQQIARQTGNMVSQTRKQQKNKSGVPVNGPRGMQPATSIMRTPGGAPNPYDSNGGGESRNANGLVMGPTQMPMGMSLTPSAIPSAPMGMPPTGMPPTGMGMPSGMGMSPQFWN